MDFISPIMNCIFWTNYVVATLHGCWAETKNSCIKIQFPDEHTVKISGDVFDANMSHNLQP